MQDFKCWSYTDLMQVQQVSGDGNGDGDGESYGGRFTQRGGSSSAAGAGGKECFTVVPAASKPIPRAGKDDDDERLYEVVVDAGKVTLSTGVTMQQVGV